jgi:DNA helicase-2/ATP-dependent DNA helicase PcrA
VGCQAADAAPRGRPKEPTQPRPEEATQPRPEEATQLGPAGEHGLPTKNGSLGPVLGRSVLVRPGQEPPPAWQGCERVKAASTELLEAAWLARQPLVIELDEEEGAAGPAGPAEVERRPVWSLSPSFCFAGEQWVHAVFANSVDARYGRPQWPLAEMATSLGASAGGPADVVLPSGETAFCDGGPLVWHGPIDLGPLAANAVVVPRIAVLAGSLVPFGPNRTAAVLAPDQLAAVTHTGGAARVIAPAGSGKTRVLTERARHLLRHWRLPGRAVTLVAFNKRAAEEMKERTPDLPELQVRTLNSLGLSLVTGSEAAATIEERQVRAVLDTLVDLPRRANADPASAWVDALSAVRLGLRSPAEVEAEFEGDVDGLPEVFSRYRHILSERGWVDFDEQIYRALEILLTDPVARQRARASCRVLLVDEFQDLTPAHLLLVRLLAGPDGAVFGVGDDDQTIYGYSGASPEWLIGFRRYFPAAGEHALTVNYRCPPAVVDAARNLLSRNRQRVRKEIVGAPSRAPQEGKLVVTEAGDGALFSTVATVETLLASGAGPSDVAVLTRVNASLAGVQIALVHKGVPVARAVDSSYLGRSGVEAALAWLRLAAAPAGRLAARDVVMAAKRPSRALSPKVVEWMSEQGSVAKLEALAGRLRNRDADKVNAFLADLARVRRRAKRGTAAQVLRCVRDEVGLDSAMELLDSSRRRLDRSAQTDDLDALVALAALHPEVEGFEEWLSQSLRKQGSAAGVALSTVHKVKGREWPHVVLHEATDGLFPHRLAEDLEEERRVFHVGLTRCSSSLHVVTGDPPSRFVAEMRGGTALPGPRAAQAARQGRPGSRPGTPMPGSEGRLERRRSSLRPGAPAPLRPGAAAPLRPGAPGPLPPGATPGAPSPVAEDRLRRALRAWRSQRAAKDKKPPFVFLHDRTLEALARAAPASMAALSRVPGIGPAKLEAYGDELLSVIAEASAGVAQGEAVSQGRADRPGTGTGPPAGVPQGDPVSPPH